MHAGMARDRERGCANVRVRETGRESERERYIYIKLGGAGAGGGGREREQFSLEEDVGRVSHSPCSQICSCT